jgi:hypothetical protein
MGQAELKKNKDIQKNINIYKMIINKKLFILKPVKEGNNTG